MWSVSTSGGAVSIVRKPDGTVVVGVRITLKPGRDDELIALILGAKKLAPVIREAMRSGILQTQAYQQETGDSAMESVGIDL